MTINIIQVITTTMDTDRNIISTRSTERYAIIPDAGKALKNIKTGQITCGNIYIVQKSKLKNYVEVDDPFALEE